MTLVSSLTFVTFLSFVSFVDLENLITFEIFVILRTFRILVIFVTLTGLFALLDRTFVQIFGHFKITTNWDAPQVLVKSNTMGCWNADFLGLELSLDANLFASDLPRLGCENTSVSCKHSGFGNFGTFSSFMLFSVFEVNTASTSSIVGNFSKFRRLSILMMFRMFRTFRRFIKLSEHLLTQFTTVQSFGLIQIEDRTCVV